MQSALRAASHNGASRPQLCQSRRGRLQICAYTLKNAALDRKEERKSELATLLASGIIVGACTSPALAEDALAVAAAPITSELPASTAPAFSVVAEPSAPLLTAPSVQAEGQEAVAAVAVAGAEVAAAAVSAPEIHGPTSAPAPSSALLLTYAGLGSAAVGFLATFFVAPRFREAFKESVDWREMYGVLVARGGVRSVSPDEAYARARKGAVLLDVRLASQSSSLAPQPSTAVPLYQPISGWSLAANIRRAGFAFFGIFGTELNPDFVAQVEACVPRSKEVLVLCESGGSLDNKPGTQFGFQSRSLKAIYFLQQAGYTRVTHVKGGLREWQRAGLPLTSSSPSEADPAAPQQQQVGSSRQAGAGSPPASPSGTTTAGSSSSSGRFRTPAAPAPPSGTRSLRAAARELMASSRSR